MAEIIIFGGGCFWCTEAIFKELKGVNEVIPGYAGGNKLNPTYEEVCSGTTGHAEVIKVTYDPKIISLPVLLEVFFVSHDPTSLNQQGADVGTQYRSIILYTDSKQLSVIKKKIRPEYVTEVKKLDRFYIAENYHQGYYSKNSSAPYCKVVISPKLNKIRKEFSLILTR